MAEMVYGRGIKHNEGGKNALRRDDTIYRVILDGLFFQRHSLVGGIYNVKMALILLAWVSRY